MQMQLQKTNLVPCDSPHHNCIIYPSESIYKFSVNKCSKQVFIHSLVLNLLGNVYTKYIVEYKVLNIHYYQKY